MFEIGHQVFARSAGGNALADSGQQTSGGAGRSVRPLGNGFARRLNGVRLLSSDVTISVARLNPSRR